MEPHSVKFSWSAPFSLNITDYEPDILYYFVNIITADDNTTMSTTDTVYLLQPDLCFSSEYRVEIAAVNIVGMGEKYSSPPLSLEGNYIATRSTPLYCCLNQCFMQHWVCWVPVLYLGRSFQWLTSRYNYILVAPLLFRCFSTYLYIYIWFTHVVAVASIPTFNLACIDLLHLVCLIFGNFIPMHLIRNAVLLVQISSSCQEGIYYNIELIPTYSTKKVVISNSSSVGQTSLTLSSPDIQLNEYYEAVVRIEGSTLLHHLEISRHEQSNIMNQYRTNKISSFIHALHKYCG